MPTVGVKRNLLFEALGRTFTDDEFQRLCFAFGLELDEVTTEKQMITKEQGKGSALATTASEDVIYRIDIPANRYDLLCLEGIVLGIRIFQGLVAPPLYKPIKPATPLKIIVKPSTARVRPFIIGAILRDLHFTPDTYASFIDLQDKLHQNICRKRSLVSIGTHDLDTVEAPFYYDALPPAAFKFVPLNQTEEFTGEGVMALYAHHAQLKQYLPIIKDKEVYPLVTDKNGTVLSLPPIINSDHSKITLNTKNVLIECTALDKTKARVVVDTLCAMFSQYCNVGFTVETVEVVTVDGRSKFYPDLNYRSEVISAKMANAIIGIDEKPETIVKLLNKMCLSSELSNDGDTIKVQVPPTRHDVMHACDVYEDVAIAYGYNKILRTIPKTSTFGCQLPVNKLTELLRGPVAQAGFTEALTFTLCSADDLGVKLGRGEGEGVNEVVRISNPKTLEFEVCRTTLVPGLLRTLAANRGMALPLRVFEVADVVLREEGSEVGARNERRLGAVHCGRSAGFEVVHGLLDRMMGWLEVRWNEEGGIGGYYLEACDDPAYFPGRCAKIICDGADIGRIGVIHPKVLQNFELTNACSAVEINLQPFV